MTGYGVVIFSLAGRTDRPIDPGIVFLYGHPSIHDLHPTHSHIGGIRSYLPGGPVGHKTHGHHSGMGTGMSRASEDTTLSPTQLYRQLLTLKPQLEQPHVVHPHG